MRTAWSLASLSLVACFGQPPAVASTDGCEQDTSMCAPTEGGETGSSTSVGSTASVGESSESTAAASTNAATSSTTSSSSTDTDADETFCEALGEALFCDDFDSGMLEAVWGTATTQGGATVGLTSTQVVSAPFAAEFQIPAAPGASEATLAVAPPAAAPFIGTARAAVRLGSSCFDVGGFPRRRVMSFSFYDNSAVFVSGVRIELGSQSSAIYQWGVVATSIETLPGIATDTWIEIELNIDATANIVVVRLDGADVWSGTVEPIPTDIVPHLTLGPWATVNPDQCAMWIDNVAVLPSGL